MPAPRRAIPIRKPPVRAAGDAAKALASLCSEAFLTDSERVLLRRARDAVLAAHFLERAAAQERADAAAMDEAQQAHLHEESR